MRPFVFRPRQEGLQILAHRPWGRRRRASLSPSVLPMAAALLRSRAMLALLAAGFFPLLPAPGCVVEKDAPRARHARLRVRCAKTPISLRFREAATLSLPSIRRLGCMRGMRTSPRCMRTSPPLPEPRSSPSATTGRRPNKAHKMRSYTSLLLFGLAFSSAPRVRAETRRLDGGDFFEDGAVNSWSIPSSCLSAF